LDDLRKKGILSEAEFQEKKAELLAKMQFNPTRPPCQG
jgi:hypothetical protein